MNAEMSLFYLSVDVFLFVLIVYLLVLVYAAYKIVEAIDRQIEPSRYFAYLCIAAVLWLAGFFAVLSAVAYFEIK